MFGNTLDKMIQIRDEKKAQDGGFTLIELLVVVVIIGILIAIAIPLYLNYEKGAADKSAQSDLRASVSTLSQCYSENSNTYPAAAAVTGSGTENANLVFTCGTGAAATTETANVSDGTTLTYTPAAGGASYTMTAWNANGNKTSSTNDYSYSSSTGGSIGG